MQWENRGCICYFSTSSLPNMSPKNSQTFLFFAQALPVLQNYNFFFSPKITKNFYLI